MAKGIWIGLVFLILLVGMVLLYFLYEKPVKNGGEIIISYTNLTIFAEDMKGNQIKTHYLVYSEDGTLYDVGITDKYGGVRQFVATNKTYYIRNENFPEQNYYTTEIKISPTNPNKVTRIVLKLEERGEIKIEQEGGFDIDKRIKLNLYENKSFQNLMYCLKWSERLIFVNANGERMNEPLDDNYKCYETYRTLNSKTNYVVMIDYETISSLTETDYIRVQFYDTDEIGKNQTYIKRQEYLLV